jgi:hypothetical protein
VGMAMLQTQCAAHCHLEYLASVAGMAMLKT